MIPLPSIIQQIFADSKEDFVSAFNPSFAGLRVLNHIISCRTPELGAAVYECKCGERRIVYHSCRDRHCPVCQGINNARWAEKQMASSLPVKYFHIVFTLPDFLNPLVLANPREAFNALFAAASSALLKLCADQRYLGIKPGFTAVLHTWGQTMQFHPHLHVILTAGGLSSDGARFVDKSCLQFLFPVKVLSRLFRGIFADALGKSVPLSKELKSSIFNTEFFCYLKEPLERADNAVKYLARYASRVCISESRIVAYGKTEGTVAFSYKDNKDGGKQKTMAIPAIEFVRRFLLHVLPKRFTKIRHYGILANCGKLDRISRCRRMLSAAVDFIVRSFQKAFMPVCKKCGNPLPAALHLSAMELNAKMLC